MLGQRTTTSKYNLMGSELVVTIQERDLGIVVDGSMKMSTQCAAAVKKANSMLGIIRKGTENKTASIMLPLQKSMVRPHLEDCVQFWSTHLKKGYYGAGKSVEKGNSDDPGAGASPL